MGEIDCFGILGDPVSHSLSPALFKAAFAHCSINATYEHLHVTREQLPVFFNRLRSGEIAGVNVTIPHKQAVIPFLDTLTPEAKAIGAVNTIFRRNDCLVGDNTDARGFWAALGTPLQQELAGAQVAVVGAGGASRAICWVLAQNGVAGIHLINKTASHAQDLSDSIKAIRKDIFTHTYLLSDLENVPLELVDLLVNTTSLGMAENNWPDLLFVERLPSYCVVADVVYTPDKTPLLAKAKKCGCKTLSGSGMFLQQAAIAFEIFTGKKAPLGVMKKTFFAQQGMDKH